MARKRENAVQERVPTASPKIPSAAAKGVKRRAADALKVSRGLFPAELNDQDNWKSLRGKLAQVLGKFLSGKRPLVERAI